MWYLPGAGIEPESPALAGGFLTTEPPEKSYPHFCYGHTPSLSHWIQWPGPHVLNLSASLDLVDPSFNHFSPVILFLFLIFLFPQSFLLLNEKPQNWHSMPLHASYFWIWISRNIPILYSHRSLIWNEVFTPQMKLGQNKTSGPPLPSTYHLFLPKSSPFLLDTPICPVNQLSDLWVPLDYTLSLISHIYSICQFCSHYTRTHPFLPSLLLP